jgi:hypothetical protein
MKDWSAKRSPHHARRIDAPETMGQRDDPLRHADAVRTISFCMAAFAAAD